MRKVTLVAAVALLCGGPLAGRARAEEPTVKVGVMLIDTGAAATYSSNFKRQADTAAMLLNKEGGPQIEIVPVTHSGTPAAAIASATRAVQKEGARYLTGFFFTSITLSLSTKLTPLGALLLDPASYSDEMTGKNCQRNYFRFSPSDQMFTNAIGELVARSQVGSWNLIAADFAGGHSADSRFQELVKSHGGTVGLSLFTPTGTSDFGSYISQLAAAKADGLFVTEVGSDAVTFAKQQAQYGLFKGTRLVIGNAFTNLTLLPGQGDAVLGVYQALAYLPSLPAPRNQQYVAAYRAMWKDDPQSGDVFNALDGLKHAMLAAGSTAVEPVRAALETLRYESIYGPVEVRAADHQVIRPVVLSQVEKGADGSLGFAVKSVVPGAALTAAPSPDCRM